MRTPTEDVLVHPGSYGLQPFYNLLVVQRHECDEDEDEYASNDPS